MSLKDSKKELRIKQSEGYILGLIQKCPQLVDVCDLDMYNLPDWSLPVVEYEEKLRRTMNKWRKIYEQLRSPTRS
jgi:hypothetical protein